MTEKFPELEWHDVVERVEQALFRIESDAGIGTGFAISVSAPRSEREPFGITIVTALHVVTPFPRGPDFKLIRHTTNENVEARLTDIGILPIGADKYDTCVLLGFSREKILDQSDLLPILPYESQLKRGAEIGWLGYPGIIYPEAGFFSGRISGFRSDPPAYLVDGVAVNGVSGGPVFDNRCHIVGFVSAYLPNVQSEMTLPGLAIFVPINAVLFYLQNKLGARLV